MKRNARIVTLGVFAACSLTVTPTLRAQPADAWTMTGSLNVSRYAHPATLLPNGKVLVAGGNSASGGLSSAELYDPATGMWTATGNMTIQRGGYPTATLLPNGKVLVAGGSAGYYLSSAELYDPATGKWTVTGAMNRVRSIHAAVLLPNGKVLVAGGAGAGNYSLASAELYDPATGTWTLTGSMANIRYGLSATLLLNGKVLVAGGWAGGSRLSTAELYDPESGTWSTTGSMTTVRNFPTATLLPNGKVMVVGSEDSGFYHITELYEPATGIWTTTGALTNMQDVTTATLLPNGKVLATGSAGTNSFNSELYDPATASWAATSSRNTNSFGQSATLLQNGKVLVAGGYNSGYLSGAELFSYSTAPSITNQPASGTVSSGGTATLTVGIAGTPPFTYQWQFNGTNLSGATNASLSIANFSVANAGGYSVTVSNSVGGVSSRIATLASVDITMFAGVIVNGPLGSNYLIQAAASLASTNWTSLTNVALPAQPYIYIDYSSPTNAKQFYRALPQ